ncbi:flagellar biosynthesis protein FlhA [Hydrogenibacillus sp. N12]|uniref:flagellar biosynthesis protein FlhA n=1 Tax=Hydrogenibacillus sp. N12 TaxID=2866627 RepID=UPI001C7DA599|nr:flagellar biosynthesis protein FlhA [Hydrogenibacillus sp. N12]QZA33516.1 flagellar biosynthesis protein FlhA [Hydrogenibacillus sp. N12]
MRREAVVFIGVVAIVLMMVVPLPPPLLDFLILLNLALSLTVLLVAMSTRDPLEFSVFPTLLLITTLFRLALNVSTTRSILSRMTGGEVIHAFGSFVVGGEPVVGFIVFLILVIIQFLVITKGAERVAEVAARFTLDAMPGKQMSIDADLGAGLIDEAEARRRRAALEREADFYGAMDGASKFVKGDAIAALIILAVNIVGGLIIGVLVHGKSLSEAASIYTVLSVGEGLVAQIPALFVSTATGILVTRAASGEGLVRELETQLFAYPQLLYIVAGVLLLLGVLTPIPFLAAGPLAGLVAFGGYRIDRLAKAPSPPPEAEAPREPVRPESALELLDAEPVEVEFGYALIPLADPKQGGDLMERVLMIRRQLALELGFIVPTIRLRDNLQLRPNAYIIKIHGAVVGRGEVRPDRLFAVGGERELPGERTVDPAFGLPAYWIDPQDRDAAELGGYTVVDPSSVLATHLTELIRRHAHELLGRDETKALVDHVRKRHPALVDDLLGVLTVGEVQKVLAGLLRERISIRRLPTIFEALADHGAKVKDPALLTEFARQALARQITAQFAREGVIRVIQLGPDLEQKILERIQRTDFGEFVALSPEELEAFFRRLKEARRPFEAAGEPPVVLTSPAVRRHVADLLTRLQPDWTVLSYNELEPTVEVQSISVVTAS